MKVLRIILYSLLSLLIILLVAGFIIVRNKSNGTKPLYEGEIDVPGIRHDVKVMSGERGMTHIYAENEHDLCMAVGFILAQERLWQMDLIHRATTGELSEIFGANYAETDYFLRLPRI